MKKVLLFFIYAVLALAPLSAAPSSSDDSNHTVSYEGETISTAGNITGGHGSETANNNLVIIQSSTIEGSSSPLFNTHIIGGWAVNNQANGNTVEITDSTVNRNITGGQATFGTQANHNTVVALISSFPFAINWTQEHVPGIVHLTQCSQELGNGLADVLFGKYNPAGRTTQTWVKDILDLPNLLDYDIKNGRTYMYFQGEPLYPFGYGLSYTSFEYSNLKVDKKRDNFVFSFDLKNVGGRDGEEVVQIYAKVSGDDAAKRLRGFDRIFVKAGETQKVEITVPAEDLMLWNSDKHQFELNKGEAQFMVGASSEDIRLTKTMKI